MWKVEYDNDVDSNDIRLFEWWNITNGGMTFRTNDQEDAYWLCDILNQEEESHE